MALTQLSMPLYVLPSDLIDRMQLDAGTTGVMAEVIKSIIRAQIYVQGKIDGQLVRTSLNCMYWLDADAFSGLTPGGLFRIELPNGLIRQDTPVVVNMSGEVQSDYYDNMLPGVLFGSNGPFQTLTTADPSLYFVDYVRGYLLMDARSARNRYVQVQCDSGFEPGTNPLPTAGLPAWSSANTYAVGAQVVDAGSAWTCVNPVLATPGIEPSVDTQGTFWTPAYIPIEPVPIAIYEAIMAYAPIIFDASVSKDRNTERLSKIALGEAFVINQLIPYIRQKGFSFRPSWVTSTVEMH